MTKTTTAAFAGAAMLALAVPTTTHAGEEDPAIIVDSKAAVAEWQAQTGNKLSRAMRYPDPRFRNVPHGVVQIAFAVDANGRPTDFVTLHNSGSRRTESAARQALARMRNLDDAPVRNVEQRQFVANLIYAKSIDDRDTLLAQLKDVETSRMADGGAYSGAISITG